MSQKLISDADVAPLEETRPIPINTLLVPLPWHNRRIVRTIDEIYMRRVKVIDHASGACMRAVREVLEAAFGIKDFYARYATERVERNPGDDNDPWARDVERSLRNRQMAVPVEEAIPGDLLFQWRTAATGTLNARGEPNFYGHVGILMPGNLIFENINPKHRPLGFARGMLSLTPYEAWPYGPSTVIRFDPRR
jgi:hypothetical protein